MSFDNLRAEVEKHEKTQRESHLRVNKLLAQRDLSYESKYQEKRNSILSELVATRSDIADLEARLNKKRAEADRLSRSLEKLDEDRANWEPM